MVLQFVLKFFRLPGVLGAALSVTCFALGADVAKKPFDLPADVAARSLKAFAQQSGVEVLIRAELGREIRTQLVKGEFTPREALDRMLLHTGLTVKEDEQTGVMAIMAAGTATGGNGSAKSDLNAESSKKKPRNHENQKFHCPVNRLARSYVGSDSCNERR